MSIALSLLLIAVSSVTSFLLGSRRGRKNSPPPRVCVTDENGFYDPTGKTAMVVDPITSAGRGRIRFQGTTWPAQGLGKPYRAGEQVVISGLDNITMIVKERNGQGSGGRSRSSKEKKS